MGTHYSTFYLRNNILEDPTMFQLPESWALTMVDDIPDQS